MALIIGNSERSKYVMTVNNGSNNNINLGDSAIVKMADKPVKTAMKAASKIVESGADFISAPALWLKGMQENWLTYMILIAIILTTITFLYCVIRSCFATKRNAWPINYLIEIATAIVNKNHLAQAQISNSTSTSSSARPTSAADLTV